MTLHLDECMLIQSIQIYHLRNEIQFWFLQKLDSHTQTLLYIYLHTNKYFYLKKTLPAYVQMYNDDVDNDVDDNDDAFHSNCICKNKQKQLVLTGPSVT
jgi:hypothetical protein